MAYALGGIRMTDEEKQRIDENFKKLMKDDSGKIIGV
jgi:hypothetical protein